jgi:hypothetical protein
MQILQNRIFSNSRKYHHDDVNKKNPTVSFGSIPAIHENSPYKETLHNVLVVLTCKIR